MFCLGRRNNKKVGFLNVSIVNDSIISFKQRDIFSQMENKRFASVDGTLQQQRSQRGHSVIAARLFFRQNAQTEHHQRHTAYFISFTKIQFVSFL